jgi:hypothetical protein
MKRVLVASTVVGLVALTGTVGTFVNRGFPDAKSKDLTPTGPPTGQLPAGAPFVAQPAEITSPAPAGSAQPYLTTDKGGRIWLSWLEPRQSGGHRFQLASFRNGQWSAPVTIAEGANFMANWADVPSIFVTSTGTIAAHWLERGVGRGTYDYGVRVSTSTDDGRTWTQAVTPHKDNTPTEHGFVSFFEGPRGRPGLVWLDGRASAGHSSGGHGGAMALRAAVLGGGAAREEIEEIVIDDRVCDCCPTSAASTSDGVIVVYRDRSDREIRDISTVRFAGGVWSKPVAVHGDGWQINGCPVNGPAVAAAGRSAVAAWFTSAGGTARVRIAFSSDGGQSFGAPSELAAPATLGRVAAVMPEPERAFVASLERPTSGGSLVVREARAGAPIGPAILVGQMGTERPSGFPRLAIAGKQALFAWTDAPRGGPSRVKVAAATLR